MANEEILSKLDDFIKKYYKNKLIRGVLYSIILLLSFFIVLSIVEYFGYYSSLIRSLLFYSYILIALTIIYSFICVPLFKILRIGRRLSYKEASNIIGSFFPEVSDKLLNLLQLQEKLKENESDLLEASISQRTSELSPVPFVKAIDYKKNKKYFKWAIIPILIIVLITIFYPSLISEPTFRYINHTRYFERPSPFKFKILNKELRVIQHGDLELRLKIEGDMLVDEVDIYVNNNLFHMKKEKKDIFSYSFKQLNSSVDFYFESSGIRSADYKIEVLPKPILLDLQAIITYPPYTGMKEELFSNVSNFSVPKGSVIRWQAITRDTKKFIFDFSGNNNIITPDKNGRVSYSKKILSDLNYRVFTQNDYTLYSDSLEFSIVSIPDLNPQIAVIEQRDSINPERIYFRGQIKDDYGFTNLKFNLELVEEGVKKITKIIIPFNKLEKAQEFYYYYDLKEIGIKPGDRILYYFEVWDNDGVNGVKSTRSNTFSIEIPTIEEIEKEAEKTSNEIKREADQSISELKKMQQEIKELNKKILQKKELDWQDKKQVEELIKRQEEIKNTLKEISKKIQENNSLEQKYKNQDEEILRKQKELEKLFNEVMNDEMKKIFEELKKLTEKQLDKDKLKESLDKLKISNEDLEKQLDRNLEMFKHLEVEKKIQETIDKLNNTAQEQKKLSEETSKNPKDNKDIQKRQSQLTKSFEEIKKDIEEINKKGQKLEEPQTLNRDQEKEESISQDQNSANKQLQSGKNKEASKSQKSASEKMEKMSEEMQSDKDQQEQEQLEEDASLVRQILKNLVKLSLSQEALLNKVKQISVTDPQYQQLINSQNKIKDDMRMISDSLFAMSKRQPQVGMAINKELVAIDNQIANSIENLLKYNQGIYGTYRNTGAASYQQYAMTSMNNLALMLAESLNKMQNQMKSNSQSKSNSKGKPKSSCNNPGKSGKKPSPGNMRQMQEALNKEMERLRKELEGQKSGNQGKPKIGEGAKLNEELARMAAQQEMIRKMMSEYAGEQKAEGGQANGNLDNLMKQMEQTENDIVNKAISQQTINRQNNILTRMLEHEKAEKKKEQEQRRESIEGKEMLNNNGQFIEFNKLKSRELELFKQIPPVFSPYYKEKVDGFFFNLNPKKAN